MNVSKLVAAIRNADKGAESAFKACGTAAEILVEDFDATKTEKVEFPRLMKLAKDAVKAEKLALKHERTVWEYVSANLLVQMAPGVLVKMPAKTGEVLKRADEIQPTVRNIKSAAKQIRDSVGLSDGRKGNAKKRGNKKPSAVQDVGESIRKLAQENVQALRDILKPLGITLRVAKS